MNTDKAKYNKQNGSALILVVVVTVLLAVVGVMFLMVSRASELETSAVVQSRDLDNAVNTVVTRINDVLTKDLLGDNDVLVDSDNSDESYDAFNLSDPWLCDLEPDWSSGVPMWRHPSDLYEFFGAVALPAQVAQNTTGPSWPADADGDGVTDSYWVQVPSLASSHGKPVYAAVRIIDNCAMLNLNGAYCFYQPPYDSADPVSPFAKPWFSNVIDYQDYVTDINMSDVTSAKKHLYHTNSAGSGRYPTEINYMPFLRGHDLNGDFFAVGEGDYQYGLMIARNMYDTVNGQPFPPDLCYAGFRQMESLLTGYRFFDIGDELELRNRYLLTSQAESWVEQEDVLNYTLDAGGATYVALKIPVNQADFTYWALRTNPANFDAWSGSAGYEYRYDRRHVCTAYSVDRGLRPGVTPDRYPEIDTQLNNLLIGGQITAGQAEQIRGLFCTPGPTSLCLYGITANQIMNSYECRAQIVKVLYAFRAYYISIGYEIREAALMSAQIVANLIDYSDNAFVGNPFMRPTVQSEWRVFDYGDQQPEDCTFLNAYFINQMIYEVVYREIGESNQRIYDALYASGMMNFGLQQSDIVFGYEKQPFISEVYVQWDNTNGNLLGFAIELLNPYHEYAGEMKLEGWKIKIGNGVVNEDIAGSADFIPRYDTSAGSPGRYVIRSDAGVSLAAGPLVTPTYEIAALSNLGAAFIAGENLQIQLLRPAPAISSGSVSNQYICVDVVDSDKVRSLFVNGQNALKRDDKNWNFVKGEFAAQSTDTSDYTHTLGQINNVNVSGGGFQIAVADDGHPLTRWHELETLGLYGNGFEIPASGFSSSSGGPSMAMAALDPNSLPTITWTLANLESDEVPFFDLTGDSSDLLDYVTTSDQTDSGTVPGRININTAPVHVIAAAIPPTLADPNAIDPTQRATLSALQLAQKIVDYRKNIGAFTKVSDLLNIPEFEQYVGSQTWGVPGADNVGMQSIDDDIEEEHWMLSCLANKFTVRSDVFTAYILVRLGTDGPQRRMIAIFDRSGVWDENDRPELVALHPVPDPR